MTPVLPEPPAPHKPRHAGLGWVLLLTLPVLTLVEFLRHDGGLGGLLASLLVSLAVCALIGGVWLAVATLFHRGRWR